MHVPGFLVPVAVERRADYERGARAMAAFLCEHAAPRVVEGWAEGLAAGEETSFPRAVAAEEGEAVVFGWMEFPDQAACEACIAAVTADPRAQADMAGAPYDPRRMVFGGFDAMVEA